jgi:multiple sugar transport system substrate-binding protein
MTLTPARRRLAAAAGMALLGSAAPALAEPTIFLSTQLRPIEEAQKVRNEILSGYDGEVEFVPEEDGQMPVRMQAEIATGAGEVGLVGALHGQLPALAEVDGLQPLDDLMASLGERQILPTFVELGKLGTEHQLYVPWMQATYIMAASRQALDHLPEGADLNALTYADLAAWGKAMTEATGERKIGFPAGPKGLMNRFFQGYLYPSYTGGVVRTFKNDDAQAMWAEFKDLWQYVSPRSSSYAFMQEPLLAGEVWVAFDHTTRLREAFLQKPDEFVAFPAPAGPKGRGFMPVLAGLAIPKTSPDPKAAADLITYLTAPETQIATLKAVGFYPVADIPYPEDLPAGTRVVADAIAAMTGAPDALPSLLPVGLGAQGDAFSKIYTDTFQLIVMRGADIGETLDRQGAQLEALIAETGAACWAPDAPSDGPCPIE